MVDGRLLSQGGFLSPAFGQAGFTPGESTPLFTRGAQFSPETQELLKRLSAAQIERGELGTDLSNILPQLGTSLTEFQRAITSSVTAFPVRENLEAEAKILVPLDTPVRNLLPRVPGAGTATQWRQATSLGGGYGAENHTSGPDQPGGVSSIRAFFAESGAPAEHTTVYANKSLGYKLLGTFGSVTTFAASAGANFMNQLAAERTHQIRNLMLNEENALINGSSTSTAAPWGDGTTALAFDGFINLVTTANGTPSAQVQTSVGPLTLSHVDGQLKGIWTQGGQQQYIICAAQEMLSFVHLAEAAGSIIRISADAQANAPLGIGVSHYKHPITGEPVPIMVSRFCPPGTMLFGSKFLPDGTPAADVSVLPQVQLPALAPNENVQGYTAQELAPTTAAPQVLPFIVTVFEVLRVKSSTVWAKSTGLTAI